MEFKLLEGDDNNINYELIYNIFIIFILIKQGNVF